MWSSKPPKKSHLQLKYRLIKCVLQNQKQKEKTSIHQHPAIVFLLCSSKNMFETTMAIFKNTMVFEASQPSVESRALAWSSGALFFREKKKQRGWNGEKHMENIADVIISNKTWGNCTCFELEHAKTTFILLFFLTMKEHFLKNKNRNQQELSNSPVFLGIIIPRLSWLRALSEKWGSCSGFFRWERAEHVLIYTSVTQWVCIFA